MIFRTVLSAAIAMALLSTATAQAQSTPQERFAAVKRQTDEAAALAQAAVGEAVDVVLATQSAVQFADQSVAVPEGSWPSLSRVAVRLRVNPASFISIEGHISRAEYRSLGDAVSMILRARRAHAVRETLIALGVGANQISTVSYGESPPPPDIAPPNPWGDVGAASLDIVVPEAAAGEGCERQQGLGGGRLP